MKFILIDKILDLQSGQQIKTVKGVSLAEEYLADHFPIFPVLPGVLLLEGLVESASWLIREKTGFSQSMVILQKARNVKYKSFAAPGMQIEYVVKVDEIGHNSSSFTGTGTCGSEAIVEAKLTLRHFNLSEKDKSLAKADIKVIENMKNRYKLLIG